MIRKGEVEVVLQDRKNKELIISNLKPGEFFGEIELLRGGKSIANVRAGPDSDVGTVFDYVTIQSGQSLWQLAESVAPTSDPRDVIAEIVSLNQLPSENVQPGQRLALPTRF